LEESFTTTISELTREEEIRLERNIVWVFHSPRTYWVSKLFSYNLNIMEQPMIGSHLGIITDRRKEGFLTNKEIHELRNNYFFHDKYKDTWKFFLRKLILNRIHVEFHDLSKPIIILEYPDSSFGADIIVDCFPESKVIILVLDGRNIVQSQKSSLLKNNKMLFGSGYSIPKMPEFIEQQSKMWVKMIEIFNQLEIIHSKNKLLILKFETLVDNIKENLKRIYQFLDVQIDDENLQNISKKILEDERTKVLLRNWRDSFTEEEISLMEKIMGNTLRKLGYK